MGLHAPTSHFLRGQIAPTGQISSYELDKRELALREVPNFLVMTEPEVGPSHNFR